MELFLPPKNAKLTKDSVYYKTTETFRRRSEASKIKARKYWSDKRHRRRVDKKQAKPVDVFTMYGEFVATYPSSRKAAIAMFPDKKYKSAERCIRACRQKNNEKKSYLGYMFRDHEEGVTRIEPYKVKERKKGYHINRNPKTYATKGMTVRFGDGTEVRFGSIKECAKAVHGTCSGIWLALKQQRKYKGLTFIKEERKKQ